MSSLESQVFKGVSWMGFFNFFSQFFSWAMTVLIARILVPGDYGLMAMATIFSGYALVLSDLGLGNAIIQRLLVSKNELSSVFWFSTLISLGLAISCFPVSYLTAYLMHEPRVIPITQTVSVIFLLSGLQIVPGSILRKKMDFKSIGFIDMCSTIVSSAGMLGIAVAGGGVWTLIFGFIIRSVARTILLFRKARWLPSWHYNFKESRPFLSFGILVALGRSVFYVQEKSDRFFAGRLWKPGQLGLYTFALDLAQIPTEKIATLINSVTFPAFSELQNDQMEFNRLYLNITKVTAMIVLPLFIGGFVLGQDLIRLLLNEKWLPIIPLFRILCLAQILTSLSSINNFVHSAQGRPGWSLYYNIASAVAMSVSFFFAAKHGLIALTLPWVSTYLVLCTGWMFISIRKFGITLGRYSRNMLHPIVATSIMAAVLVIIRGASHMPSSKVLQVLFLVGFVVLGGVLYASYFWFLDRNFLLTLRKFLKK
jgi:O-antigen/teichoic acid export membrane protein